MKIVTANRVRLWKGAALALLGLLAVVSGLPLVLEGAGGPKTITINYLEKSYGPVSFDHALHTTLASGCGACHHMHSEKAYATCKECHSLKPEAFKASVSQQFLPCSGCHTDLSPESPGMPSLKVALHKKCFECHLGIGELGSSPAGCVKTCHARKATATR